MIAYITVTEWVLLLLSQSYQIFVYILLAIYEYIT
jgi:hypothetical protein